MRFYLGKGCRIEEGRWTGDPEDLRWYADEGATQWDRVTEEIRKHACKKRTSNRTDVKPDEDLFSKKKGGRNERGNTGRVSRRAKNMGDG